MEPPPRPVLFLELPRVSVTLVELALCSQTGLGVLSPSTGGAGPLLGPPEVPNQLYPLVSFALASTAPSG